MWAFGPINIMEEIKKNYFYVGIYEVSEVESGTVIGSRFSGVVSVNADAAPGPVYSLIIKEWFEKIQESIDDDKQTLKIYLEKLERIE